MLPVTIASFKCHTDDSSTYSLLLDGKEYVFERTWFNASRPTDKKLEREISLSFETVANPFIRCANLTLDTTKDYNYDVTEYQKVLVQGAIQAAKDYAQYHGVELDS